MLYTFSFSSSDLEVIVGSSEFFEELNKLLQLKDHLVTIFYDTIFNLGDFYVSTVAIQHPMFKETPVLPIAFMLHERKFQSCHEHFIEELKKKITKLSEKIFAVSLTGKRVLSTRFNQNSQIAKFLYVGIIF